MKEIISIIRKDVLKYKKIMENKDFSLQDDDREKIKSAVKFHNPMEITSYTLPKNMEVYIQEVLAEFLTECHQEHMIEYLQFCVDELLNNSKKANTKRIYFAEKNLDINNEEDYKEGMIFFKDETLLNIDHYLDAQKKAGLYIKLILKKTDNLITIEIRNNCALTKFEKERIEEKIDLAMHYDSISDVFSSVLDQTEGAGLGIIIIILMLQKIGLSKDSYQVFSTDTETITKIELPLNEDIKNQINEVSQSFAKSQDTIPILDTSMEELEALLRESNSTEAELTSFFSKDISSAFFLLAQACLLQKDCSSLVQAVKLLGKEKIAEAFARDNPKLRVIAATEELKALWQNDYNIAFYAYNLIQNFPPKNNITKEQMYTIALIHNIETLLIEVATPAQKEEVLEDCLKLGIPEAIIELFYKENYLYKCGNLISENWGLPPLINDVFANLYEIKNATATTKEILGYLYLADVILCYKNKRVDYYQINQDILGSFGIDSETKFNYIIYQMDSILSD